ncbi:hypothetical protein BJ741DRAFT_178 [Chytriomyces cf. hyalinus JEL632]|nr:hypothetical protein BJ741DRAFT_178 [Chytriomyces cf. hyalinus JEL632]
MHSWREYFSQRSPTNRATAPLAPPSQEIPLPTPPAKPTKPAVPGQPEVPSAGHSRLLIAASFEETGEAALKSDFSNGIEEENGENADENTEDDDDEEEDTETDTEDDEDEDTEDDTEGVANDKEDEKAEGNEHVKVFILTKARAPVKDRKVEGCILHTLLKNRHEEQETPRPRTPAPIIMSWDGVVDCPTKRTAATPAPSLMDSQYNAMQLLQPTPFATPTPPADFDAFTHNSYNNNPLLITPSVTPFYDSTTWNLFAAHVPLPCPHEPDFPAVMGLQSLPLLDPLLMTPFPAPATTNDWNYNLPPPSAEFPADWLTAPTPDDLSILGLEFLLFGGGV